MTAIKLAADAYRQRRMLAFDFAAGRVTAAPPARPGSQCAGENCKEPE